jgi:prepilin-type N-terminal cleavage/methylation domain-containing protein/prepilin-type processing-associated H-X9-DG protein
MSYRSSCRHRGAFTLVEMLVVIAIIGVLAALLLPAINMAREAARRAACLSNQHQFGQAVHNYNSAKNRLPSLRCYPFGFPTQTNWNDAPQNYFGWAHQLLPYLDQQQLDDMISSHLRSKGASSNVYALLDGSPNRLKIFVCGSDTTNKDGGLTSYAANGGRNDNLSTTGYQDYPANGLFMSTMQGSSGTPKVWKKVLLGDSGNDSTSTTIMFTENVDLGKWYQAHNEYDVAVVWMVDASPAQVGINVDTEQVDFADTTSYSSGNYVYARPSSYHSGGFNVCMADGSTRYINANISAAVYAKLMASRDTQTQDPFGASGKPYPSWMDDAPLTDGSF